MSPSVVADYLPSCRACPCSSFYETEVPLATRRFPSIGTFRLMHSLSMFARGHRSGPGKWLLRTPYEFQHLCERSQLRERANFGARLLLCSRNVKRGSVNTSRLPGNPEQAKVWRLHQLVACAIQAQGAFWAADALCQRRLGLSCRQDSSPRIGVSSAWQREPDRNTPAET